MWSRVFPNLNRRCQEGDIWLMNSLPSHITCQFLLVLFCLQNIIQLWEVAARKIYSAYRFIRICFSCIKHNKSFQIGMCFRSNGKIVIRFCHLLWLYSVNWIIKYFWMVYFSLLLDFLLWKIRQSHNKIIGTLHVTIKYKCINIIWTKNYSGQLP